MPQVINTNIMSLISQRALNESQLSMQSSVERLSSGLRINRAKDDAAGLAISERITAQIRGLNQAVRNANDGISMLQTTEGAIDEISNALQRMRELAVQASTGTVSSAGGATSDKGKLNLEFQALADEIKRIIDSTEFNGTKVLDGTSPTLTLQVGYQDNDNNRFAISFANLTSLNAYVTAGSPTVNGTELQTAAGAQAELGKIDADLDAVTNSRAAIGATQNRLESTVRNLANVVENQSAARSRVQDADFAVETSNLTRTQSLQQAGAALLAEANLLPQKMLQPLG